MEKISQCIALGKRDVGIHINTAQSIKGQIDYHHAILIRRIIDYFIRVARLHGGAVGKSYDIVNYMLSCSIQQLNAGDLVISKNFPDDYMIACLVIQYFNRT